jgi:hypothetical protein
MGLWSYENLSRTWTKFHEFCMYSETCLIRPTKGPGKCVGLYSMSEYSGFILINRNNMRP